MYKLIACLVVLGSANAGYLQLNGQITANPSSNTNNNNNAYPSPLTLNPGPTPQQQQQLIQQQAQINNPHVSGILRTNQQLQYQPTATSSTYRQQQVSSVPATVTTQGLATGYVTVPASASASVGSNSASASAASGSPGISANGYGYGSYGYTYTTATGNLTPQNGPIAAVSSNQQNPYGSNIGNSAEARATLNNAHPQTQAYSG